jgi:hypothetical protein
MPILYSSASTLPRLAPGQLPITIGVQERPDGATGFVPVVGIASPAGRIGGWRVDPETGMDTDEWLGPIEQVWRVEVRGEEVEGRFVLRGGAFVQLAEDVE